MQNTFTEFSTNAILKIGDEALLELYKTAKQPELYTFVRTTNSKAGIIVDSIPYTIEANSIFALTTVQYFQFISGEDLVVYQFNREFYCIKDHDQEVSCAGLLFFGNVHIPIIELNEKENRKLNILHEVFLDELETEDTIQAEMLRMLMARFIIITTRLLKAKEGFVETTKNTKIDLLREFNLLVESFFKTEHSVSFYADKLYKSPKTLSNTFAKLNTSPLQIIHERIILEAKRLLIYTDKTAKEIAYEVGFDDASHLSRLFKRHTSLSPSDFKKQLQKFS
ncbi:AraC family transcriptional regulator [Jejuia pallidilutea]|jgi:AraC-like DNA-binding protein|uniref:Transcriptional regulator n=1 Tax=Jejuia pallidilutea TaxID=504487 RepID=A0A090VQI9_9FLAO|nr:helix-turn-helix domain-containing protein [Jejuia pallidilutea]GAL65584.1 transcriptional regulator [Jejuia pallidilutea]GAL70145.1 transcriptional regulator [Jejuia pallidilutea]GAL88882.1 transcriptional regulator [Jejuia pallidilutea]